MSIKGEEIGILQKAANYVLFPLKLSKITHIIWGLINIIAGLIFVSENIINGFTVVIGVFQIVAGVWNSAKPRPKGILIDGLIFSLVGIWNISISLYDITLIQQYIANHYYYYYKPSWFSVWLQSDGLWLYFGIAGLFFFGIPKFRNYARISKQPYERPSNENAERVREILKTAQNASQYQSQDLIEFIERWSGVRWKGTIMGAVGTFVGVKGMIFKKAVDAVFVRPEEVKIVASGETVRGGFVKAQSVELGSRSFYKCVITPASVTNFEQKWRNYNATLYPPPPPPS
jgi:hypothetical protein